MTAPAPERVRELVVETKATLERVGDTPQHPGFPDLLANRETWRDILAAAEALPDAQARIAELEAQLNRTLNELVPDLAQQRIAILETQVAFLKQRLREAGLPEDGDA